jgi:Ni/Co efflux regulator RcnB
LAEKRHSSTEFIKMLPFMNMTVAFSLLSGRCADNLRIGGMVPPRHRGPTMRKYLISSLIAAALLMPTAATAQIATARVGATSTSENDGAFHRGVGRRIEWARGEHSRGEWRNRGRQKAQGASSSATIRVEESRSNRRDWHDRNEAQRDGYQYDRNQDGRLDRRWDRWDSNWRYDRRYDWRGHRDRHRHHYHPGRYYAPHRHDHYRRFSVGIFIGAPYYTNRYWISDPWAYHLPHAHGPYRWVRYYDDVLLIDIRNGYVVDVIHNFFW